MHHHSPIGTLTLLAVVLLLPAVTRAEPAAPGADRCLVAARVFLDGLVPDQRKRAVTAFDNEFRRKPVFPPGAAPARTGIRTGELTDGQRIRLHDFLSCGLSSQGYQKVLAIMRRNDLVKETLGKVPLAERETRADTGSGFYWITIFGEPVPDKPWGWRLEGHHLALNFTAAGGELAVYPAFMATDPAVMTKGLWAGFRVMDAEFSRGLELLESLMPTQRQRAILSPALPPAMFDTPDRAERLRKFAGVPASGMNAAQRRLLMRVIDEYVGNAESGTAERLRERIEADGDDELFFAWMGPTDRGKPVYYRVHGPSIVIEFLHAADVRSTTGEADINHIHTWWHVPGGDFGDALGRPRSGAVAPGKTGGS